MTQRILILCHGHPDEYPGGGEIAALQEHEELLRRGFPSRFVAASHHSAELAQGALVAHSRDETELLFFGVSDPFMFSQQKTQCVWDDFGDLLKRFRPTIVHIQHYFRLGLEFVFAIRRFSFDLPIVMTLHEHLALCHHHGQMIKTYDGSLCNRSTPVDCARCYPEYGADRFALRERWVRSAFDEVDLFITPSEFLRSRYISWGLDPDRIVMLENGQPETAGVPPRSVRPGERRDRFAFMGQMAPHKGPQVLIEAFGMLPEELTATAHLSIHGGNLEFQPEQFQSLIRRLRAESVGVIEWTGSYQVSEIPELMQAIDWLVVPSIWWENSPLVIQEAFAHHRPVICSDVGGMAEKVVDGETGLHFEMGSATSLAQVMTRAAGEDGLWDHLSAQIRPAPTIEQTCGRLIEIFEGITGREGALPQPGSNGMRYSRGPG